MPALDAAAPDESPGFVERALRRAELSGERHYNYVRLTLIALSAALFTVGFGGQTPLADLLWGVAIAVYVAWSLLLLVYFRRTETLVPWVRYAIVLVDQSIVYATAFACLANYSGAYEIYRSPFIWTLIAGFNGLSALRYSVGLSLFAALTTIALGTIEVIALYQWQPGLFVPRSTFIGEGLLLSDCVEIYTFAAFPAVLAAAAAHYGRRLVIEAAHLARDASTLREENQAQLQFLRVASHELRTPITALKLTTQQLLREAERRPELLQRLERQTARINRLIEQLLDTGRIGTAPLPLELGTCDLVAICKSAIDSLGDAARVELETPDGPILGRWDALRLDQVVANLVGNALRYSAAEEKVTVRLRSDGARACLEVIDRGIGIAEGSHHALFTRFFRTPEAQRMYAGGFGLGLYIAHEIVKRHGGTIEVDSAPGEGATFRVELPMAQ